MRHSLLAPLFACLVVLLNQSTATAVMCSADTWGGRSANIQSYGATEATISAQTNLIHLGAHALCQGTFSARAQLVGVGADCATIDDETHYPSGAGTLAFAQRNCVIPQCSFTYYAGGTHAGFGESEHYTLSPGDVSIPCPCLGDGSFCENDGQCCSGFCGIETNRCGSSSPILLNLASNSPNFQLTSAAWA